MFRSDGLPVWADRHEITADVAAHDHDFLEIALVTQGRALHVSVDGDHPIRPGSAVVIPPNQWHAYRECEDLVVFDCFVAPELVHTTLPFLDAELPLMAGLHASTLPLPQRVQLGPGDLSAAIAELYSMSDITSGPRSRVQIIGHLLIYLDLLSHAWVAEDSVARRRRAKLHPAVSCAVKVMEDDPGRLWTLAELGALTSVERTYLVRLFQRDLGVSPIAYLNQLREQAAARLLVQTDQAVARIGAQLGWGDAGYFARRFKAAYGLTPSAYRRRALNGQGRDHYPTDSEPTEQ
ncbi:helix-turn-helix domain-containing protein [Streptomyces sp. 110]|uniref:Helix-turn-helix domain-containing protein n=1 Tax=Streptomyces endocoffeicus TaxID=2898945 RepID=A0ABS1Q0K0_9ACTN|nr:AraC family transcriptional regulator [Streptomyces endocoffeicus]MBL1118193.1 helix-turn-helix domain-containing protein [Streptomyces endocoffeicus]